MNLFPDSLKKSSYEYFSYISSELKSKNEMTVITAFFDIQRDQWNAANGKKSKFSRTNDDYFEYFSRLAKIQNDLIIYTEEKFAEKILKIRSELRIAKTTVVIVVSDLFGNSLIKKMNEKINNVLSDYFRNYVYKPDSPEYNSSRYITVNALKACFVQDAIDCGYVNTDQSAWIDFGYCRSEEVLDQNITWTFDCKGKINLFHLKNLDSIPVFEVVRSGNVYIQGGHILAPNDKWIYLKKSIDKALQALLQSGMVDDDQTLLLMAYREAPENFIVHPVNPIDWFIIFKLFNDSRPVSNNFSFSTNGNRENFSQYYATRLRVWLIRKLSKNNSRRALWG